MTIESEITRIQNNIAAAYTAASGKGATLPATENSDNLATCIGSIPSGGGGGSTGLKISVTFQNGKNWDDIDSFYIGYNSALFIDKIDLRYIKECFPITLNGGSVNDTIYYAIEYGKGTTVTPDSGSITLQSSYEELNFIVS